MEKVDINQAHEELMFELFGRSDQSTRIEGVTRARYTKAMEKIQDKYGLKQGHPDFLGWILTCVGHSPIIIEDTEGDEEHEPK